VGERVTINHDVDPDGWENYRGQWVAVRRGEIIAAAVKLDDLFADPRYQPGDGVWRVPEAGIHFYSAAVPA
jgi:hypothetical protein